MVNINGAVQAIGLALLVLFFVVGVVRTCGSFTDVKKPEHALKLFIRFAIAKGVITYGLELMLALFDIVQGTISTIMTSAGFGTPNQTTLPAEMVTTIESCGFFESIPLWAVTLIGGLFITVLSFIMIMTVYGRFFKTGISQRKELLMEVKINREIRNYTESMFFGLSLRQFIFSVLACAVAVGLYFLLKPYLGTETVSWVCILGAAPFAALGFVKYNGMTAEKFIWAWIKSEFLMPKKLVFHSTNTYYELMKSTIEQKQKIKKEN